MASVHDYYKEGRLIHSLPAAMTEGNSRYRTFNRGEKWRPTKVELRRDEVRLNVVTVQEYGGVRFKTTVVFQFEKNHPLDSTDFDRVLKTMSELFSVDDTAKAVPAAPPPETPMAEPPPPPAPPPPTAEPAAPPKPIEAGQTIDQVVAILGQPTRIVSLGAKKIYIYKDLKATFQDGKLAVIE
jgi:hypothetical protein